MKIISFKTLFYLLALQVIILFQTSELLAKGGEPFRYDKDKITKRKNLKDAYARFKKVYRPYNPDQSNLKAEVAKKLERLFTLTDMAVIEKVLLLEFIGKIHEGDLPRDTHYKNYYREILFEMSNLKLKDERLIKIREDLIKGINYHREVLDAWLEAARRDRVDSVKNASGRWVHYGTSAGDKIFYSLFYKYIKTNFKEEYPENLEALSRHLCVLVF
jgi:hypothetical protein